MTISRKKRLLNIYAGCLTIIVLGGPLGGHLTFQILTLLRYVVDMGLNSPNPNFFLNPMKTDQGEAYQSSEIGLFSCFWTTPWNIAKIITYMVKSDLFVSVT